MQDCQVEIKQVLAALDLSHYSELTFLHALTLAEALKAELVLLNVINTRPLESIDRLSALGYDLDRERYLSQLRTERQEVFEREYLARAKARGVPARLMFRQGLPWEQIVKAAREEKATLLVMGAKGRSALEHVLFGTAAEKVFRHAPCPVVSVRGPEHCRLPA
ncbi:MAG: universal stress protein [Deltaproteobacteria bacterium]|nr:universal stress protein [Deltaproteobacteria bacterium]